MGFDLHGNGQTDQGAYFRNNVWWWRPLWQFVCENCDFLTENEKTSGNYNDGVFISGAKATRIANKLAELISEGKVSDYETRYEAQRKKGFKSLECTYCNGTGERDDAHVAGQCNVCEGDGKMDDLMASYPFNEDNVVNFMNFCGESEGFEIW